METKFWQWARALSLLALVMVFAVAVQTVVAGTGVGAREDRVVVWVFDVGQGDAIFIDAPDAQVLIDGGPSDEILEKLSAVMPFWDRTIDLVINTHPHADHVTGLNHVLERYIVEEVWVSGQDYTTETFAYFQSLTDIDAQAVSEGDGFALGGGAQLDVLWPKQEITGERIDDPNAGSVVTLLTFGELDMLLTGDIGVEEEFEILDTFDAVDVLKVGHQGSKTSSSMAFLTKADPEIAVISVGQNDYGHPHKSVVDRIESIGSTILRTDQDGDVRILFNDSRVMVTLFDL